jgi:hypothetical protein
MSIKKIKAKSPDPYLSKTIGDNTLARIAHVNQLVDQINSTSLVGPAGPQGVQGPTGPQGVPGPVGPAGLTWRGSWVSGTSYILNNAVGYNGASYFCTSATSGTTTPNLDTTHWALLASQGAIGPAGATGAQGPTGPQGQAAVNGTLQTVTDNGNNNTTNNIYSKNNNSIVGVKSNDNRPRAYMSHFGNSGYLTLFTPILDEGTIKVNNITANRDYQLPDASGTLALEKYKVYTALLTQTGTADPTAVVLENTTGQTINWIYGGFPGYYIATYSSTFDPQKTFILIGSGSMSINQNISLMAGIGFSNNLIEIFAATLNNPSQDNVLKNTAIEIRIYP